MVEWHDTVVVGGGQAGLAMSYHLRQRGRDHIVLERAEIGERWRRERWDSLAFQMPNWSLELPGMAYDGDDPDGFARHTEILTFIEDYARKIEAPVRTGTAVTRLSANEAGEGFRLETTEGPVCARRVVIATGPFHQPAIPGFAADLPPNIVQTDATRYRSPAALPEGAVVVVGSGSSGTQIAEDLMRSGRQVFLSLGRHRYAPRRYRGRDVIWWLDRLGRFDVDIDAFPGRKYPPPTVMTGVDRGYDLFPRLLGNRGVTLLGRVTGTTHATLELADDLNRLLDAADASCADFITAADALADEQGLGGRDEDPWVPPVVHRFAEPQSLDLLAADVGSVVWATGYRPEYGWVDLPVFDPEGRPDQTWGISRVPGIYFLGLHWMRNFRSGLLSWVGRDAAYLADHMDKAP